MSVRHLRGCAAHPVSAGGSPPLCSRPCGRGWGCPWGSEGQRQARRCPSRGAPLLSQHLPGGDEVCSAAPPSGTGTGPSPSLVAWNVGYLSTWDSRAIFCAPESPQQKLPGWGGPSPQAGLCPLSWAGPARVEAPLLSVECGQGPSILPWGLGSPCCSPGLWPSRVSAR